MHTINNLLIHHKINSLENSEDIDSPKLTPIQQKVKDSINDFLTKMLGILHTEVAKNW